MILVLAVGLGIAAVGYGTATTTAGTAGRPPRSSVPRPTVSRGRTPPSTSVPRVSRSPDRRPALWCRGPSSHGASPASSRPPPARLERLLAPGPPGRYELVRHPFGGSNEELKLQLTPSIPWVLDVQTGAVDGVLDLTNVTLEALTLKAGASSIDVTVDLGSSREPP